MAAQAPNRFVLCVLVVEFAANGNQAIGYDFVTSLTCNDIETVFQYQ